MAQPPVDPSGTLTPSVPSEPIPDIADQILSIPDYVSPAHWLLVAMNVVFGFNPAEEAAHWFAGDWRGLATNASAFRNLAAFERELSTNVTQSTREAGQSWEGNAATAAGSFFDGFAQSLQEHGTALTNLATQYEATAKGVWALGKAAVSALELIGDYLIDLALDLAATALLAETGIGAVVGVGIAAFLIYKATSTWVRVVDLHGKVIAAAEALSGFVTGELASLHGLTRTPLPGAAYDNKLVS